MLRLSDFDYALPAERIAQFPLPERDRSKLLVLSRETGELAHRIVRDLPEYLRPDDLLVLNDTRVTAHRLFGHRAGHPSERVETFLTRNIAEGEWEALVKPGRKLPPGVIVEFQNGLSAEVMSRMEARGGRLLLFRSSSALPVEEAIAAQAIVPLPPYIKQPLPADESERYQTVYGRQGGSAAAPTAGLHFTQTLLDEIARIGVRIVTVTLHIGLGTFRPIETEDVTAHVMHAERISINPDVAAAINETTGRIVAIGTTSARVLESAAIGKRKVAACDRETNLYIMPGYEFQIVDALMTNFHVPRSSLLVLVSALAGQDLMRRAYAEALERGYRFLSFGDAMFIC